MRCSFGARGKLLIWTLFNPANRIFNVFAEIMDGKFRNERLNQNWFRDIEGAQTLNRPCGIYNYAFSHTQPLFFERPNSLSRYV